MLVGNPPFRIDEKSFRDSPDAIVDGDLPRGVTPVRVGNLKLFEKGEGLLFCVLDINPDKDNIFISISLPDCLQVPCLSPAGRTPRGPEVEKNHFSSKLGEAERLAIKKRYGERGGRSTNQGGSDVTGITTEAEGENPDQRENDCQGKKDATPRHVRPATPIFADRARQRRWCPGI